MTDMEDLNELDSYEIGRLVIDLIRRSALHYGLWFSEVIHQLGLEEAIDIESDVFEKYIPIISKRLSNVMGFEIENGLPSALTNMPRKQTIKLIDALTSTWLITDGTWLQVIERQHEILTAKRCNDTCWIRFSQLEASNIKSLLNLPESGGLDSLKLAFKYRLFNMVHNQKIESEGNSLILTMLSCQIQDRRRRRGMEDYDCELASIIKYSSFARTIDPKIKTACIACPPKSYKNGFACAWRFYID